MIPWHWELSFFAFDDSHVLSFQITSEQANRLLDAYAPDAERYEPGETEIMPYVFVGAVRD